MTEMMEHDRRVYDTRAKEEAWSFAAELLEPIQKTAELAGSDELIEALKHADERCVREINAALDERAALTGEEV